MTEKQLKGKTAIVAAGAKNLGGLISRDLAKLGANIVIHYHSGGTEAEARETLAAVEAAGAQGLLISGDLTKVSEVERLFQEAKAAFGGIDIAVNTVGKVLRKPIVETTEEEYDSMFDINAKSAYFFIREAGKTSTTAARSSPS